MRTDDLATPTIPARYALIVVEAAEAHGVGPDALWERAGIAPHLVDDTNARMSALHLRSLLEAAIELTGEPALGYEIGLGSSLMSHGLMGFGMMTSSSVREAISLGVEFLQLRLPVLSAELRVEGGVAAVTVVETAPLGDLRRFLFDTFLVKLSRIGTSLTDGVIGVDDVELWFDYEEPEYHARMRDRLPRMRFEMGSNEVRFDAAVLERRLETADPINARFVEEQCRRELEQLGLADDVVGRVRALLRTREAGYPTLAEAAQRLHTSSRTLKRRLHEHGTSFHQILDAERRGEAIRLLSSTTLSVEQVARRLGYADASSFRRAFSAWTGRNPSDFRGERRATP